MKQTICNVVLTFDNTTEINAAVKILTDLHYSHYVLDEQIEVYESLTPDGWKDLMSVIDRETRLNSNNAEVR